MKKKLLICLITITVPLLSSCGEKYRLPYAWCVEEIKTHEGYEEIECYTYERAINESQTHYEYTYKIVTTTLNKENKAIDTVWYCSITFEPNFRNKFLQTMRTSGTPDFEQSEIKTIDCDILYTIMEGDNL